MEAMIDAGVHMGFSRDVARTLVLKTMQGSVECVFTGLFLVFQLFHDTCELQVASSKAVTSVSSTKIRSPDR